MTLQNLHLLTNAPLVGQVLLDVVSHLEPFSGNGIYYGRGMPTMNKYKTAKEVCALTGLTRKHLYYFHHENVVRAVAYANYSVEGHDGYKLYDDAAVEKLRQIALYYQLGLKRNEIRDLMLARDYDRNQVLGNLLRLAKGQRDQLNRNIAALEFLQMTGMNNGLAEMLQAISLEELGEALLAMERVQPDIPEAFLAELEQLLIELSRSPHDTPAMDELLEKIFFRAEAHLDSNGTPFLLGLFVSVLGGGELARGIQITTEQADTALRYLADHPELYKKYLQARKSAYINRTEECK